MSRAERRVPRLLEANPEAFRLIQHNDARCPPLPLVAAMAPTPAKPFHRDGWVYEEKYDGWRKIAYKNGPDVRLVIRNGVDHTERFPEPSRRRGRSNH